ncbi:MAG: MBL fold metallo-hydrolase [Pedobacter sp.]|nr:MAG: MBL fold metallo-hydrolase [Pedobacter sp.]
MNINALELDFLAVGENSKSGDAIAIRFGNYENSRWNQQTVFVIDGGNSSSGQKLIDHVKNVYKSNSIDRVILTHPDGDHASGLRQVCEEMNIGKIWMHTPWNHWKELHQFCHDGRITTNSFEERLRRAYDYADQIENIAIKRKIEIFAPKQGAYYHHDNEKLVTVLGPGKDYYVSLIQDSDKTPRMQGTSSQKTFSGEKVSRYEDLSFETENLTAESESTSAENNMSLVLYLTIAGKKILLTGDSGCDGLYKSIYYAKTQGINLSELDLMQIPHHGSRHNLSQGILREIQAPVGIISCAKNGQPSHPSSIVTNALIRRKITPHTTQGSNVFFRYGNAPAREGYTSSIPVSFENYVDVYP